jgi:hypothetical protein
MDVDPVQHRAGDTFLVTCDYRVGTGAFFEPIAIIAARAGIHTRYTKHIPKIPQLFPNINIYSSQLTIYSRGYNTSLEKNLWKNACKKSYLALDLAPADHAKH